MDLNELEFLDLINGLENKYIDDWKSSGNKIIGYYCSLVPEELLHAAGLMPYRIRANVSTDTALADAILSRYNCSYVRCSLNLALEGKYDFLDGLIVTTSCDHIRRMYDIWLRKVDLANNNPDFLLMFISIPHVVTKHGIKFLLEEISMIKQEIENKYNIKIKNEDIKQSVLLYNKNRELLRKIHGFCSLDDPKLKASEMLKIVIANASVPKEIANQNLEKILKIIDARKPIKNKTRLMVIGSYIDKPEFFEIFEDVGGSVVSGFFCNGLRAFYDDVESSNDPIGDLLRRYYEKAYCPRMMRRHGSRLEFIKNQIDEARVEGVVLERLEFCDLHGVENMMLEHELEDLGIPVLSIDREYLLGDIARFKTRIEAFIEQIKIGVID